MTETNVPCRYHLKECVEARTRWVRTLLSWLYTALYAMAGVRYLYLD